VLWLVALLTLSLRGLALTPSELWLKTQMAENQPIVYDEVVVDSVDNDVVVHYYKVYRQNWEKERREETGLYNEDILQVSIRKGANLYLWLGSLPHVLQMVTPKKEEWVPEKIERGFLDDKELIVLYLYSHNKPLTIRKYIRPEDNLVLKEEILVKNKLVQIRERRNIQLVPELGEDLFNIPIGYQVYSERRHWELALVSSFIETKSRTNVFYPSWLPSAWELTDINLNQLDSIEVVVYRFFDGEDFYSLFQRPKDTSPTNESTSSYQKLQIVYKDNMGVFQLEKNNCIITLVGKIKEKDARKIIESLTLLW